jgi:hypothetical protein
MHVSLPFEGYLARLSPPRRAAGWMPLGGFRAAGAAIIVAASGYVAYREAHVSKHGRSAEAP